MKLYRIPGAYVFGIFGAFGSGKTLYLVEQAIEFACYHRKSISANFYLNERAIRFYGRRYNLDWLAIVRIRHSLSFSDLLAQENSILLLDEAGVEIFSRSWKDRRAAELDALFRIRHYRNKLLYCAQDWNQIDIQFRRQTHLCLWVRGFQIYPQHSDPILISRLILFFHPSKFENFIKDPINKVKIFYPIFQSGFRFIFNFVRGDFRFKLLFCCYNSFDSHRTKKKITRKMNFIDFDNNFNLPNSKSKVRINEDFDIDSLL